MTTAAQGLPAPVGPYSHAMTANGFVFCAGQLALDPETSEPLASLSVREQTRMVLDNLEKTLLSEGSSLRGVLRTTVYLANLDDYAEVNEVYREVFGDHRPARATFEVSRLIGDLSVEIDAVAVVTPQVMTPRP
ncbi:RidA family protein [Pseudonocardia spinosispora]|uniref:RidA family protein n=1 Tax=Pseudonocardia spinosispora TaxID=103441 RepID=UPI00048F3162|nr:Rid family detoxifying hydrolase [Pseudonocardia spinosispora]